MQVEGQDGLLWHLTSRRERGFWSNPRKRVPCGFALGTENSETYLKTLTPKEHFSSPGGERLPWMEDVTVLRWEDWRGMDGLFKSCRPGKKGQEGSLGWLAEAGCFWGRWTGRSTLSQRNAWFRQVGPYQAAKHSLPAKQNKTMGNTQSISARDLGERSPLLHCPHDASFCSMSTSELEELHFNWTWEQMFSSSWPPEPFNQWETSAKA